jgi:hypothetical protein
MDHPKALIRSRKRAAPPSTDAPRVKKKRSSATGKTAIAQDPTVNDHMYVRNRALVAKLITNALY